MSDVLSFTAGLSKMAWHSYFSMEYRQALGIYHRITRIDNKSVEAWFGKAISHQQLQEYWKAIYGYQQVHRYDPQNIAALNNAGICYFELGYKKAAIDRYKKVINIQIEKKNSNSFAFKNLINVYLELDEAPSALLVSDLYLKCFPDSIEAKETRLEIIQSKAIPNLINFKPR